MDRYILCREQLDPLPPVLAPGLRPLSADHRTERFKLQAEGLNID